jgi:hypothetical protein
MQRQLDDLRAEVEAAQALAREALEQVHVARRVGTELVRVALGVLIEPGPSRIEKAWMMLASGVRSNMATR